MSDQVAAIILNWNCAQDTLRCVRAVTAGDVKPVVIVVDNGSGDDSLDVLRSSGEDFDLVPLPSNLGYAGGMNAGIRAAAERGAQYVWLLNADCVPRPTALTELLRQADGFAISASLQVSSARPDDGEDEPYLVAAMLPQGRVVPFRCGGCAVGVHEVDVVTGASMFAEVSALLNVGLFDESFFHYKEEFDLVVRIRQAGGRAGFVCSSRVWHLRGGSLHGSSPRAQYYHYRNEILFVRKHYARPLGRMLLREPVHYKNLMRAVAGIASPARRPAARAVFAGYWDGLHGVHGPTERF